MNIHYYGDGALVTNEIDELYLTGTELKFMLSVAELFNTAKWKRQVLIRAYNQAIPNVNVRKKTVLLKFLEESINCDEGIDIKYSGKEHYYYPHHITLFITNRCAHKCKHCFRCASNSGREMPISDVLNILSILSPFVPSIEISGGEPLIHVASSEIINAVKKFNFSTYVSSLYGIKDGDIYLLKNLDEIQVSLYGHDSLSHDSFTRTEGSFEIVCDNIRKLVDVGANVKICFMNNSPNDIYRKAELAISLGVKKVVFGTISPVGRASNPNSDISFFEVNNGILNELIWKYSGMINIDIDDGCYDKNRNGVCGAGYNKLDIDEYGNIYPCLFGNSGSVGNILESGNEFFLKKYIFNGDSFKYKCDAFEKNLQYMIKERLNGI